jgi:hypothetical protein
MIKILSTALLSLSLIACGNDSGVCDGSPYVGDQYDFWYGHRAASTYLDDVENSIEALNHAINDQHLLNKIEFDIRSTKDRELIIMHDSNTCRVNGIDQEVLYTSYKDLAPLKNGEKVPRFSDYVDVFLLNKSIYKKNIQVDVKNFDMSLLQEFIIHINKLKEYYNVSVTIFRKNADKMGLAGKCNILLKHNINPTYLSENGNKMCK